MRDKDIRDALRQAVLRQGRGDYAFAEATYSRILRASPAHPEANFRMGLLAAAAREFADAVCFLEKAVLADPSSPNYAFELCHTQAILGRTEEALEGFRSTCARLRSGDVQLADNRQLIPAARLVAHLLARRQYCLCLELVAALPDALVSAELLAHAASAFMQLGDARAAAGQLRKALPRAACAEDAAQLHSRLLSSLVACDDVTPVALHAEALRWDGLHGLSPMPPSAPAKSSPDGGLPRLGIISRSFRRHTTATILLPLLPELARHFTLFAYCDERLQDDYTVRYKSLFKGWRDVSALSEVEAASCIRADRLDILMDINGHLEAARPRILTCRPAPVQVHYMGGPMSLGLASVQYRISDNFADPVDCSSADSSEEILRLPRCMFAFRPLGETADPGPAPELANGYITFGSCNALCKASDTTLAMWKAALDAVPGSRLEVVRDVFDSDPGARALFERRLGRAGIDLSRVGLRSQSSTQLHSMVAYSGFDITLDSYPYCGATTTLDSLWMGVPVMGIKGGRFSTRTSASLLEAVGLGELACDDMDSFVTCVRGMCAERDRRVRLRAELGRRVVEGELGNFASLADAIATALGKTFPVVA